LLQVNGLDKKMTASQIVGYLSTISGNNIKQIEVIRNLSAAFNSSVGSVINVITKTSLSEGYFVNGRASVGNFNKCDAAVDLSIVKPKYNFSMSMAESYNKTFSNSEYRYETVYGIAFAGPYYPKTIETFDNPDVFMNNASVNVKYEYKINENQIIGGSIDYWGNSYSSILTNKTDVRRITPIPPLIQNKKESPGRSYIDLYSISTFKNKSQLDLKLNVALNNMNNRYVNQIFYPADSVLAYETIDNAKKYWTKDQDYTLKVIYKFNLFKKIVCETGTEFDYTKLNDHLKFTSSRTFEDEIFNDIRGNSNSRYDQYIAAGFLNLKSFT